MSPVVSRRMMLESWRRVRTRAFRMVLRTFLLPSIPQSRSIMRSAWKYFGCLDRLPRAPNR